MECERCGRKIGKQEQENGSCWLCAVRLREAELVEEFGRRIDAELGDWNFDAFAAYKGDGDA